MTTPFRLPTPAFLIHSQLHVRYCGRPLNLLVKMRNAVVTDSDPQRKIAAHNMKLN